MVVNDLYVVSISVVPHKANAPLVANADAMLTFAVRVERMEPVAFRAQVHQLLGRVQHYQLAARRALDVHELRNPFIVKKSLRSPAFERLNANDIMLRIKCHQIKWVAGSRFFIGRLRFPIAQST